MSKAAQRKVSAYRNGYMVGRFGWPTHVKSYRVGSVADGAWRQGVRDGRRDLAAAEALKRAWWRRLAIWLRGLLA